MSWNELKWAQMKPNELKKASISLNQSKWIQMGLNELKQAEMSEVFLCMRGGGLHHHPHPT